ncbi:MAG: GGDEF domain-containing protein, partial [Lachnospiraceae bacterium]|nr:GGDEF domain-containing protein [Lachnospiraceae bacterium]
MQMQEKTYEMDYLTNLPNRGSLYQYYAEADSDVYFHAMFLDVDNYKRVNDVYGHSMGDKLLICIADYIRECANGFISRIGGDEFVVLMDGNIPEADMIENAEKLIDGFQEMNFRKDILSLISLSVGIILKQPATHDLEDVLRKCDAAMYQAKKSGKNRYTVYEENDTSYEMIQNIEAEMDAALKNRE